jgi:hypothetical protein
VKTYAYRVLHSSVDTAAVAAAQARYEDEAFEKLKRLDLKGAARDHDSAGARALDETPLAVDAHESKATEAQIIAMIREGEIKPTDLVFENGTWTTFERSAAFFEACEDSGAPPAVSIVKPLLSIIGSVLLLILYLAIRYG